VSALDEAQEAQMKAEEAIKKAHDDISAAEKDLAQVDIHEYWWTLEWLSIYISDCHLPLIYQKHLNQYIVL
jgi:hypothetical protein